MVTVRSAVNDSLAFTRQGFLRRQRRRKKACVLARGIASPPRVNHSIRVASTSFGVSPSTARRMLQAGAHSGLVHGVHILSRAVGNPITWLVSALAWGEALRRLLMPVAAGRVTSST